MKLVVVFSLVLASCQLIFAQPEFSQENATQILRVLSVEIGPRPMGSPAENKALEFAASKFKEYGCDTSYILRMSHSSRAITTSGIAVGIKHGLNKRIICIGGHIDSAGPEIPGADDDGSGAATVMELARVFGKRQAQSTLLFCCFCGEEQGLEGSQYFVEHFADIDSIVLMVQIDMANGAGVIDIDPDTHGASAPRWLTRAAIEEFYNLGYTGLRYPANFFSLNYAMSQGSGSDHESFLHAGIPAIDFSTDVSKPIHTPQDNFENFDSRGLKRSGDVAERLVERFDAGVPGRSTEQYWLYLIGKTPIFLPLWVVWTFVAASIGLGVVAFVDVRRRRELPVTPGRIRWSGIKMVLFSAIIVSCGWLSGDIIGLVNGVRHPAVTDYTLYQFLGIFGSLFGLWLAGQLARKVRLSRCPYVFFKRAAIWLAVMCILFSLLGVKVAVYPAYALFFLSLAMISRNWLPKVIFALLAPVGFILFLFHEWFGLIAHTFGEIPPLGMPAAVGISAGVVAAFMFFFLPIMCGFVAVARDNNSLKNLGAFFASKKALAGSLLGCVAFFIYLLPRPAYNNLWYRPVHIDQKIDLSSHSTEIVLESPEYLSGIRIHHGNSDTLIETKTQSVTINPRSDVDTSWLLVDRKEQKEQSGDTTTYNVELSFSSKFRPYTVSVTYSRNEKEIQGFSSSVFSREDRHGETFRWYSFPDTIINLPVRFQVVGDDSVRENIEVVYDKLAYPMECTRELTYFTPRTKYVEERVYRK